MTKSILIGNTGDIYGQKISKLQISSKQVQTDNNSNHRNQSTQEQMKTSTYIQTPRK